MEPDCQPDSDPTEPPRYDRDDTAESVVSDADRVPKATEPPRYDRDDTAESVVSDADRVPKATENVVLRQWRRLGESTPQSTPGYTIL